MHDQRSIDIQAYGSQGYEYLSAYLLPGNEVEHILSQGTTPGDAEEFGYGARDEYVIQSLGNLMLLEKSVNIVASNAPYSMKCAIYPSSKFLLARCQEKRVHQVGLSFEAALVLAIRRSAAACCGLGVTTRTST